MKLKPYPEYKDSGISWIGKIPEGWEVNKIKNTSCVKGRIGWHGLTSEEYSDEGAYLVTGTDFKDGVIEWDDCHHIGWDRYKEDPYIHLKEDDLLITKDGTIGKVALIKILPNKATLNSGIFLVRPLNKKYIPKFMYWMLNSAVFERFFDYIKTGATISHLYQETFEKFFFPTPPKHEQTAITSFLDKKTSGIDDLIAKNKNLIVLLKEKRTALINHAVTKGLDPNVKLKDSGVDWIGEIPEGWEVHKLKYKTIINKKKLEDDINPNYVINYVDISNVDSSGNILDIEEQIFEDAPSRARRIPRSGDTIISTVRTYLKAIAYLENIPGNLIVSTGFAVLEPIKSINSKYLFYSTSSEVFIQNVIAYSKGVAYPAINPPELGQIPIIMPSLPEQTAIANYLDKATAKIDKTIQKIEKKIKLFEEFKKSLIHYVVTGKVDVRGIEA